NIADSAVRVMTTEVYTAVPNSIRLIGNRCVEMVPTTDGGRFRMAPDTTWDTINPANPSAWMDLSEPKSKFDVLTAFSSTPAAGDFVVIGNQSAADVYAGTNRAAIAAIGAPPSSTLGQSRITLAQATQFPLGYEGGSFVIVPNAQQAVSYSCTIGTDANGTGTGVLTRYSKYGFNSAPICPSAANATAAVVATKLSNCSFSYDPNQGATQQSGYLQVQLELTETKESVTMTFGAHVDNAP
ncbi:MAG: prepilin-type cleavage/methylation domain-containing protein, partial [Massilia sp.]